MEITYILIPAGLVLLSGSALIAFYWAAKTGQFRNLEQGARSIFDEEEPVGKPTECFPDHKLPSKTPNLN